MPDASGSVRVALFGTSANPPTGDRGHRGLVRWLLEARLPELGGHTIDEVWVLPVYVHPYADKQDLAPFHHRLAMSRLAFEGLDRVRVSDVERDVAAGRDGRFGTIDTLEHLRRLHPQTTFILVLGQDAYQDLRAHRWKRAAELLATTPIVAVRRPGHPGQVGHQVPNLDDISSTAARASNDFGHLRWVLGDDVAEYIRTKQLYGFSPSRES